MKDMPANVTITYKNGRAGIQITVYNSLQKFREKFRDKIMAECLFLESFMLLRLVVP